jgi:hypothetical protein
MNAGAATFPRVNAGFPAPARECGGFHLTRVNAGAPSNCRGSASHEVEDDGNHGQYQQNVNEECGDVEYEKASQPQQQQNESKN